MGYIELINFPEYLESHQVYILILSSILSSFVSSAFGIGGGAIFIGVLALFINPLALLPVHGAVQIGSNFGRMLLMINEVKKDVIIPFLIGSLIGSGFGGLLFVQFPPWLIQLLIGSFILWTIYGNFPEIKAKYFSIGGIFSSFLTMFFGATGPFVASMVGTLNLNPIQHTSTHSALMTIQHLIKVIVFILIGFSLSSYIHLIIVLILSGLIGTYFGKFLLVKFRKKYFKIFLNLILTLISLNLIFTGFKDGLL